MRSTSLTALLISVSSLAYSQTNISGGIYQNTTWSPSGNPFIASGNVVVFEDVTLTIEPGVIIKFNSAASLEIRGKLIAIGNAQDSIRFTANQSSPGINSWKGIIVKGTNSQTGDGSQVTMVYCVGEYAGYFIDLDIAYEGPYVFSHCYFGHNIQTNQDGGVPETLFDYCKFESNKRAIGYSSYKLNVTHCEFINNEIGVGGADLVDSCYFSNHSVAALEGNGIVRNCTIEKNKIGVDCDFNSGNNTFVFNSVKFNDIGLRIHKYFIGHVNFSGNTICNNTSYNIDFLDFNNAVIPFNCWCSTDSAFIRSTINDGYVNTNYGLVLYMPFNEECVEVETGLDSELKSTQAGITVYPNPFQDEINLMTGTMEAVEFSIYNLNGQRILNQTLKELARIDTRNIPQGIYFYEIRHQETVLRTGKIIKLE